MPYQQWKHTCSVSGNTAWKGEGKCAECGEQRVYDGWRLSMIEAMARYQNAYGLKTIGPHRHMADKLLRPLHARCEVCGGETILTDPVDVNWYDCPKCEGTGIFFTIPESEVDAARKKVLQAFPDAGAPSGKRIFITGKSAEDPGK